MALQNVSTTTNPRAGSWSINGEVFRLREWASGDRVHGLPDPPVPVTVGSAPTCQLQLYDPSGLLSREHATITPIVGGGWKIRDLASKNGLRRDGNRDPCFRLHPGTEITIGGLRLIAESADLVGLRSVVSRFLGWEPGRQGDVDDALRTLRDWAAQELALIVIGDGDLAPVMKRLHRLTLGVAAPFATYEGGDAAAAVRAAARGTLYVAMRHGDDVSDVVKAVRAAELPTRPQLVLSASTPLADATLKLVRSGVISLPPLSSRANEVERIIHESAPDIARELGAPSPGFTMRDHERLRALAFESIAEIEETVRRIAAMRTWGVTAGAARLGITHPSLSAWAQRRKLST
jgi:FHA domain